MASTPYSTTGVSYVGAGGNKVLVGNTTTDTVAFYGVTGSTQRSGSSQATLTYTATTGGVGFVTTAQFTAALALLDEIRATLAAVGIFKGGA